MAKSDSAQNSRRKELLMRTSEERIEEVFRQVDERNKAKAHRNYIVGTVATFVASLLILVVSGVAVSKVYMEPNGLAPTGATGSIFAQGGALGYVLIGILSFGLGVTFALFCYRLKNKSDKSDEGIKDD